MMQRHHDVACLFHVASRIELYSGGPRHRKCAESRIIFQMAESVCQSNLSTHEGFMGYAASMARLWRCVCVCAAYDSVCVMGNRKHVFLEAKAYTHAGVVAVSCGSKRVLVVFNHFAGTCSCGRARRRNRLATRAHVRISHMTTCRREPMSLFHAWFCGQTFQW